MHATSGKTNRKGRFGLGLAALVIPVAVLIPTMAYAAAGQDDLAEVRQVTAQFHSVDAAIDAGYELGYVNGAGQRIITGCIAHPTAGAMGYHYFNKALIDDLVVDVSKPEGLVYAPGPDGNLRLVSVEYVVPSANSNPPGVSEPPSVLGMDMHILVPPPGPAFYILHAWVWGHNPAGMFVDWNPEVSCA
jgi:hypothetical protein